MTTQEETEAVMRDFYERNPNALFSADILRLLSSSAAARSMREALVATALNAQLPANYQWGEDAMEAFNFGKTCAANAIEAALSPNRPLAKP